MAGINLAKRLKERSDGGANTSTKRSFGIDLGGLAGGVDEVTTMDKLRLVLMVASIAAIPYMRSYAKDYTAQIEQKKREEIAVVDQQIVAEKHKMDALKGLAQEADAFDHQMQELQRRLAVIEGLGKNRNLAVRMVDFIVSEMPESIWLASLSLDTKVDSRVDLKGNALNLQAVSEFMRRLEGAVFFPHWQLSEANKVENGGASQANSSKRESARDTRNFIMNAKVVPL